MDCIERIHEKLCARGVTVLHKRLGQGLRGSVFQKEGKWFLIINKADPPERQNFTLAHEFCEIQLHDRSDLSLNEKHRCADRMAGELLLPDDTFGVRARTCTLPELKREFPYVSHEVIARRLVHFRSVVVTILDNMHVTARFGSPDITYPGALSPPELQAARECFDTKKTAVLHAPPLDISCCYLDKINGVERIFIVADVDDCG